jgi:hypothetical protein
MDFNAMVDLIIKDLKDAGEIIDDLKNYPGVPVLQVELAKSKCKNAAEVIALLKGLQNIYPPAKNETTADIMPKLETGERYVQSSPGTENQSKERAVRENENQKTLKKTGDSAIIADTFTSLPGSLNEQMSSMRDENEDVSEIIKAKPLKNLSEAIGVNDKFLFIREIFNGNPESYNQAISRLDDAENISDARAMITSYAGNNPETESVKQLLDLVKRKFPSSYRKSQGHNIQGN